MYDAFVSYRRSDGARVARWLRRELQAFRPPKRLREKFKRPLRIYLDTAYERATADFYRDTIQPALMASRYLIIVVTPDMLKSRGADDWILREIADFSAGPNGGNILVARGAGEFDDPLPGNLSQAFPNIEIVDLRGAGRLNLVNTFRLGRLADEKLKILASLLDISPEAMPALRMEQERAQQKRIGVMAGIATSVAIGVSGLAIFALQNAWRAEQALARSQQSTSRVIAMISTLPDTGGVSGPRAVALATSCDLYDQLTDEVKGREEPSVVIDCALERASAFESHGDMARTERALRHAVMVATQRQAAFTRANAVAALHDARIALARFLARQKRSKEAIEIAKTLVADAQASIGKTNDFALMERGLFTRRFAAGKFLAELQTQTGDVTAALATYAPLDAVLQQRKKMRKRDIGSAITKEQRQKEIRKITINFARQRTELAMKLADLHGKTNAQSALEAMQHAAEHLLGAEKIIDSQAFIDLSLADISIRQLKLASGHQQLTLNHDAVSRDIRQRLKRVWNANDSSGHQRRQARKLWQRAKPLLKGLSAQQNSKAN